MYFQAAMVGLNLAQGLFGNSDSGAKKIYKAQQKTFELNKKELADQIAFQKDVTKYNFEEIAKSYGENYARLNEEYVNQKYDTHNSLKQAADKFKTQINYRGVDSSSAVMAMSYYMEAEKEKVIMDMDSDLMRQSAEMAKERSQSYINAGSNYLSALISNGQAAINNGQQNISAAQNYYATTLKNSQNRFNSFLSAATIGADMYGDYKSKTGLGASKSGKIDDGFCWI
ncbi:MAG: hypothetical protein ACRCU6_09780 [Fusobacteriaceae bacterium]